ncbi:MAG: superoxide dismutase family protein [Pseudomonadota bacterium]
MRVVQKETLKTGRLWLRAASAVLLIASAAACGKKDASDAPSQKPRLSAPSADLLDTLAPADQAHAAATFVSPDGAEIGRVVLTNTPGAGVLMRIDLKMLEEGWHGVHLHEVGDCSDGAAGFMAAGGHVNPDERAHGLLNPYGPERGNMPNIYAGPDGRATVEVFNDMIALFPSEEAAAESGPFALLDDDGFAIIVHANADDHTTQPVGGSGARIACAAAPGSATVSTPMPPSEEDSAG